MENIKLFCNKKTFQYNGFELKRGRINFKEKGDGLESKVFKIDDKTALKIYKDTYDKAKLGKKMIELLSTIKTKRIILPNNIITTEDGKTKGYSMNYIEESNKDLTDFSKEQLIEELTLLKEDLIKLGKNKVEIGDLREENTISNDKSFYLIDCGDYLLREKETTKENLYFFNSFIIEDFLTNIVFEESTNLVEGLNLLKELRLYLNDGNYIGDFLNEEMKENETINEYVKRNVI